MDARPALSLSDVVAEDDLGLQAVVPGNPHAVVIGAHLWVCHTISLGERLWSGEYNAGPKEVKRSGKKC